MRTSLARLLLIVSLALASFGAPSVALAEHQIGTPFTGTRPWQLDFHGDFLWYGWGIGGGARLGIPIMHNGFVDSIDNAIYLNFGIDTYYVDDFGYGGAGIHHYGFGLGIPVTLHWEFYFNDTWSAFGEVGFQVYLGPTIFDNNPNGWYADPGAWVIAMVGGTLHFNEVIGLTLRVGNPYVALGITLYI
jgi:hypothetical protein